MQIKFLSFRLSFRDDPEQGLLTRDSAEMAVNAYLSQGWKIQSVSTTGTNDLGTGILIVLAKEVQASR